MMTFTIQTIVANAFQTGQITSQDQHQINVLLQKGQCEAVDFEALDQLTSALISGKVTTTSPNSTPHAS